LQTGKRNCKGRWQLQLKKKAAESTIAADEAHSAWRWYTLVATPRQPVLPQLRVGVKK
jgi:hypothetical protein